MTFEEAMATVLIGATKIGRREDMYRESVLLRDGKLSAKRLIAVVGFLSVEKSRGQQQRR